MQRNKARSELGKQFVPVTDYFNTLDTYFLFSYAKKYFRRYFDLKYRVTSLLDTFNTNKTDKTQISKPLTAQLARWLGNWLPCNASRTQLVGVTNHSSLHSLLDFHHLILRQGIVMGSLNGLTPKILEKSPSNNIAQ
ncbi:hypothetical protein SFRURICE_007833 [Spodoptera frugiperda]|nr:hypothetical protein SFRURICE_007833 [Spodoptera frugiperda]